MLDWIVGCVNTLTVVSADVDQGRARDLTAEFENLLVGGLPDGLLETRLLGDGQGHWAIQSLWRDRAALDAMRASPEAPAAPALFRRFAAEPTLVVMQVFARSADPRLSGVLLSCESHGSGMRHIAAYRAEAFDRDADQRAKAESKNLSTY